MPVLLLEAPCILSFQVKIQTPVIDRSGTQIRALLNYMDDVLVFEIGENKFNLPVSAMFKDSFDNEELIGFKIKQIDSRPPEARSNDIFYSIVNHAKFIPYFISSLKTITSQQNLFRILFFLQNSGNSFNLIK